MRSLILQSCLAGICEWICCPGARNAEILQALAASPELVTWTHFDERSAGFFGLGRTQATGLPIAVVTTSGTAAAELLPAVVEAFYQGRPLVVITADRPIEFRNTGAPQSIEQTNIFADYATCTDIQDSEQIPEDLFAGWDAMRPLHINICLPEPRLDIAYRDTDYEARPPSGRPPFKQSLVQLAQALRIKAPHGMAILLGGLDPDEQAAATWFAEELQAPVLADATSGLRESLGKLCLEGGDRILREHPPELVLRIGDVPVGRFWRDLEDLPQCEVISITRTGFSGLARESHVITGDLDAVIRALGDVQKVGDPQGLLKISRRRAVIREELLVQYPESEAAMTRALSTFACLGDHIFLGNSSPIRLWNEYAQSHLPTENVRANRGANGIDGLVSTFLGNASEFDDSWIFLGDLSALYDANALALHPQMPEGKRCLAVMNNFGGGIFRTLPGAKEMSPEMTQLLIQPHEVELEYLAQLWGASYLSIRSAEDWESLEEGNNDALLLLEIFPCPQQTAAFNTAIQSIS